jgi:glutathione S-transferase
MIIYGSTMSPFVRKTVAVAREKGIAFELKPVAIADQNPDFRRISPFGKMPALDDGGFGLADSSAICHYLEAIKPQPPMIPAEARLRGRTIWFEEFADTLLFGAIGPIFFNRVVAPRFLGREGDAAAADQAEAEALPKLLDYLETQISASGYLVGETLTLADLAVASPFANLEHCGVTLDAGRYPKLVGYVATILERPSMAESVERERAFLART